MYSKTKICIANWKMNLSFEKTREFCTNYAAPLKTLALQNITLVVCPSPESLALTAGFFKESAVKVGAQNCSSFETGAFTGELSAISLAQIGCSYSIVGHSERRIYFHETNHDVALKVKNLLNVSITPIVCIGEPHRCNSVDETYAILIKQLEPIFNIIKSFSSYSIIIAYEPVWAIGTGDTPDPEYLKKIFAWLHEVCIKETSSGRCTLTYGGSVHSGTVSVLNAIPHLEGFLVGGASLHFQNFEKIVSLISV